MDQLYLTQSIYRDLLDVMSKPGSVRTIREDRSLYWPSGIIAVAAALLDQEVRFVALEDRELEQAISEATGSRKSSVEEADFIFVPTGESKGLVSSAKCGSQDFPDLGATVIYQVERLGDDEGTGDIVLQGPGIKDEAKPLIVGLAPEELSYFTERNSQYPLGIDFILVDQNDRIMALPRSLRISA